MMSLLKAKMYVVENDFYVGAASITYTKRKKKPPFDRMTKPNVQDALPHFYVVITL